MARASFVAFGFPMEGTMRAPIPTPEGLPAQAANHHHGLPLRVFVGSVALRHNQSDDRHWRRRSGAIHCGVLCLRSSLCAEADVIGPEMTEKLLSQVSSALSQGAVALLLALLGASGVHPQYALLPL